MAYLMYGGEKIEYQIVKSSRKTISIRVSQDGVCVHAPKNLSNARIAKLIETKAGWIKKKQEEIKAIKQNSQISECVDGAMYLYRGNEIKLRLIVREYAEQDKQLAKVTLVNNELIVEVGTISQDVIRQVMEKWYRNEAKKRIKERVEYYLNHYDFKKKVNRIVIKDQKSRWGSCSSKCNLNFNYRLIMAPDDVLDYVVIHELCHLLYMNHSSDFWNEVRRIRPNFEREKEWLHKNGAMLQI